MSLQYVGRLMKAKPVIIALVLLGFLVIIYSFVGIFHQNPVDFNAEVRPILDSNCIVCHGGVKQSGGFSFLFREDALGKAKSGKLPIVPGHPDQSEMIKRLTDADAEVRMPYGKTPLTAKQISTLKQWIKEGAHWEKPWSFMPPKKITPPDESDEVFVQNDIDKFILRKLGEEDLQHSPPAGKPTLLRRVSLDLTGLPPTENEVQEFLNDDSPEAYEKVVDRLLNSPAYGERWASMWLDLARYADSKGYEKDQYRNIWHYRDYVIKSFNEDKPYDQFTIEQLAGDLLPNPTDDQIIATAFHRNTMNNDEGGTDNEEFRTVELIDRVNTTFEVWQGITIGCVQCHSHPYDPIRHDEYYRFMAFLNNTRDSDLPDESPTFVTKSDFDDAKAEKIIEQIRMLTHDQTAMPETRKEKRKHYLLPDLPVRDFDDSSRVVFDNPSLKFKGENAYVAYDRINLNHVKSLYCRYNSDNGGILEVRLDKLNGPVWADLVMKSTFGEYGGTSAQVRQPVSGLHKIFYILKPNEKGVGDCRIWELQLTRDKGNDNKTLDSLRAQLEKAINPMGTPVMRELRGKDRRTTQVFNRGNWQNKGDTVECAVPQILNPFPKGAPKNRLGMAEWLVSQDNPLTARVAVNRFWEQLFGFGIVETLEDFGSQGTPPSHPELLDWLANKFVDDYHWSMKKLLKLMVMSGTYRQSSVTSKEQLALDPSNKYLSRGPRVRLTAEQIRDQALAVSGLLSKKMYGPSVMPYQPQGIWQTVYSGQQWEVSPGEDRYRRALYTYMRRTSPYPDMLIFDAPSREFCVARRTRTNTPLQALTVLNDTVFTEVSIALAKRMVNEGKDDVKHQIAQGYNIALCHPPDSTTLDALLDLFQKSSAFYKNNPDKATEMAGTLENADKIAPLTLVASAIINQDEFLTKE